MRKMNVTCVLIILIVFMSCDRQNKSNIMHLENKADSIVLNAINVIGGDMLDHAEVTFDFRNQSLSYYKNDGQFRYTRRFTDTSGHVIKDTLTNDDFMRYKDGQKLDLSQKKKESLQEGVNSIIYFAFLPYRLNDPAVIREYVGQVRIKGKPYEKIKVTFREEGGGTDHEDVYYYYFDPEDYSLEYLAYEFHVNDGGIRFRSAYNVRTIDGLTIRDYINYMVNPDSVEYAQIEEYYDDGKLKELSRIELQNVNVDLLN